MKLKSIEIKGFKSFYNRTKIEFPDGIVSVVGPNGSGKSNILDAFRWVLGEQSAKTLRGDKMEDVIFSGTTRHNQSNYCEVELIFDNADKRIDLDFSEISVKRKAFRNGESSYYINGKHSRLKEIKELFLDSGIGKEGYSIISQGKIDEVVSANSVQRRKLLEEASGIARFRFKKEESERKIENSKVNLERLEDIFSEIKRQLEPLETQKEKALIFLELNSALKKADVGVMLKEYDAFNDKKNVLTKNLQDIFEELEEVLHSLEKNRTSISAFEEHNAKIKSLIHHLEQEKNRLDIQRNVIQGDIRIADEKISGRKDRLENLNLQLRKQKESIGILEEELAKIEENSDSGKKQYSDYELQEERLTRSLTQLEQKIFEIEQSSENLTKEKKICEEQTIKNELSAQMLKENIQRDELRKEAIDLDEKRTEQQIREMELEDEVRSEKLTKMKTELYDLHRSIRETEEKKARLVIEKTNLERIIFEKRAYIDSIKLKLDTYQGMQRDMEGLSRSTKVILGNKNLKGIVDIVSNVISTEQKYEKAVETALGSALQYIITTDADSTKAAIEFLKREKQGRATFLPMDSIRGERLNVKDVILLSDIVKHEPRYRDIVLQLLGRTILAASMDEAISLAKKYNNRYRIVTLEGELFNVGGAVTGGHYYKSSNLLERKRLIEEYTIESKKQEKLLEEPKATLDNLMIQIKKVEEIEECLKEKTEGKRRSLQEPELQGFEFKNQVKHLKAYSESLRTEKAEIAEHIKILSQRIDELRSYNASLEEETGEKLTRYNELQTQRNSLLEEKRLKSEEKNQLLLKKIEIKTHLQGEENSIERIKKQIEEASVTISDGERQTRELQIGIAAIEKEIEEATFQLQLCDVEYDEIISEFEETKIEFEKESKKFESIFELKTNYENKRFELLEKKMKLESSIEKFDIQIEHIESKLKEEYQLDIQSALNIEFDANSDKSKVQNLKEAIHQLGNINMDAIAEYELLFERHEVYRLQIEDLTVSIEELQNIIQKLEKDMAKEFSESFRQINKTFGLIFSKMFGGGEGALVLNNTSDILNSEIEIHAQPPGKKLKSISVMSGGEKALIGIALLFAIQATKPAPFCILDEIDAALDDANVERFNLLLKQMSSDIQFVTITHRRGTMENSQYIYGVTMQDKGISKIVSLKFEDAKEYIEQ